LREGPWRPTVTDEQPQTVALVHGSTPGASAARPESHEMWEHEHSNCWRELLTICSSAMLATRM
jgi:hypothetical protein